MKAKKIKGFIATILLLLLFLSPGLKNHAATVSETKSPWMSYEEYFAENRLLPSGMGGAYTFPYSLSESYHKKYDSRVNAEYGETQWFHFPEGHRSANEIDELKGVYPPLLERYSELRETGVGPGEILIEKKGNQKINLLSLGVDYDNFFHTCGYMYTVKDGELCRWNKSTMEKELIFRCNEGDRITLLACHDEIAFFRCNNNVLRYYAPDKVLDFVYQSNRIQAVLPTENNVIVVRLFSEEYLKVMNAAGVDPNDSGYCFPKDFEQFYDWANNEYGLNLSVPTEEEKQRNPWKYQIQYFLDANHIQQTEVFEGYDIKTQSFIEGYVKQGELAPILPNDGYHPTSEGIVPLPDTPSPWLGNDVADLPAELEDAMSLVPTGAFWGEAVTEADHVFTSLGNNQARALLAALMEEKQITRPEKRELLTVEGKQEIPAKEIKTLFESLYGPGSAEDILAYDVIGDANAGDMLLKKENGNYVYCWAPYAGSELNAEQYIKYLSHEREGDALHVYTAYGYYRLDDRRETYKLYGDARSLRPLEFTPSTPIASGTVGDETLTKLRNGELDEGLTVYRHTFLRNGDGGYYWASSAPYSPQTEAPAEEPPSVPIWIWVGVGCLVAAGIAIPAFLHRKKKNSA